MTPCYLVTKHSCLCIASLFYSVLTEIHIHTAKTVCLTQAQLRCMLMQSKTGVCPLNPIGKVSDGAENRAHTRANSGLARQRVGSSAAARWHHQPELSRGCGWRDVRTAHWWQRHTPAGHRSGA